MAFVYSLYTLVISWLWKEVPNTWMLINLYSVSSDRLNRFWALFATQCILMQPLQWDGDVESCGTPFSRLDEGKVIVLCADMAIVV